MNNNYLNNTVVVEMNGVIHTCRNIACNSDYMDLMEKGFELEITTTSGGWASLYVLENGIRVPEIKISFRSNKQAGYKLINKSIKARRSSHLGRALFEANNIVNKNILLKSEEFHELVTGYDDSDSNESNFWNLNGPNISTLMNIYIKKIKNQKNK